VLLVLSAATLFAAPARDALDGGKAMNGVADFSRTLQAAQADAPPNGR
jgi:hypothetical protein